MPAALRFILPVVVIVCGLAASGVEDAEKRKEDAVALKIYDLRAATKTATDFPSTLFSPAHFAQASDANPFMVQAPAPMPCPADFAALLRDRMLPLEFADPVTSIEESEGRLVVMQKPAVHRQIAEILNALSARLSPQVAVQALEFGVSPELALAWLGKAGKPLPRGVVEQLLKPESGAELAAAPQLVAYNKQRCHVKAGRTFTYVAGADAVGAQLSPVVASDLSGVAMDVRPQLDFQQASVRLEFRYLRAGRKQQPRHATVAAPFIRQAAEPGSTPDAKAPQPQEEGKAPPEQPQTTPVFPNEKTSITLDLPSLERRTISTELRLPLETWVLAGVLDPLPGAAEKSLDSRHLLVFVRCEKTAEPPGAQ